MSTPKPVEGGTSTPVPTTPAATTPAATPTPTPAPYSQWTTTIPIDPALQAQQQQQQQQVTPTSYQHYQYYASHYPQYAAQQQQQQASQMVITPPTAPTAPTPRPTAGTGTGAQQQGNDISTLNDAIGSAGVDLRAEEESLQRASQNDTYSYRSFEDRTRKQPPTPSFDTRTLGTAMRTIGTQHKVTRIPDDSINYLALSLRARLQDLLVGMITAAKHRTDTQFDRPASVYEGEEGKAMWGILVRGDVAKQIVALEKVEREEEMRVRRERKERADMAAAQAAALAAQMASSMANTSAGGEGYEEEGGTKKKRKKDGPGVTARNMSDDVRKKMSNAVASQAAGLNGKKYSWMNASSSSSSAPAPSTPKPKATSPLTTTTPVSGGGGTWARPYVSSKPSAVEGEGGGGRKEREEGDERLVITKRDAMFVMEKERGHGGGRGAARGWV